MELGTTMRHGSDNKILTRATDAQDEVVTGAWEDDDSCCDEALEVIGFRGGAKGVKAVLWLYFIDLARV